MREQDLHQEQKHDRAAYDTARSGDEEREPQPKTGKSRQEVTHTAKPSQKSSESREIEWRDLRPHCMAMPITNVDVPVMSMMSVV